MKKTLLQGVCRGNRVRMVTLLAIALLTAFSYQAIAQQDQDDPLFFDCFYSLSQTTESGKLFLIICFVVRHMTCQRRRES